MTAAFERGGIRGPGDPEKSDRALDVAPGEHDPQQAVVREQSAANQPGVAARSRQIDMGGILVTPDEARRLGLAFEAPD